VRRAEVYVRERPESGAADSINHRPAAAVFMRAVRFRIRKICRKTHKFRQIRQFVIFEFYGLYLIYIYMYQS
jgi:hypothetical protein